MEEQIQRFTEQFAWEPEITHAERLPVDSSHLIVCGMGGSHLGAELLLALKPELDITIHSDYGLPHEPSARLRTALIVASSYSGETEETLDAAEKALAAGLSVAVITTGGRLAAFATEHELPCITLPKQGFEPRMAFGAGMLALAKLIGDTELEKNIRDAGNRLQTIDGKDAGTALAKKLIGSTPLVYASTRNTSIASSWKIMLNETAKIPAFTHVLPELCHNELSSFDTAPSTKELSARFHIVFLTDTEDHSRITKRMTQLQKILTARDIPFSIIPLSGARIDRVFTSVLLGVWVATALAKEYGIPDAATPLMTEFKRTMRDL